MQNHLAQKGKQSDVYQLSRIKNPWYDFIFMQFWIYCFYLIYKKLKQIITYKMK